MTRVLFSCSGIGILNRGIESFFKEAFNGLKTRPDLDCHLLKGAGDETQNETVIWNLPRTGFSANWLGKLTRRNGYVAEQWSTFFPIVWHIQKYKPQVIYYSDSNLGYLLYRFRKQVGVSYRLLFSNGGPCGPPFLRTDFVHQVAPFYYQEAITAGECPQKHLFLPYGINVCKAPKANSTVRSEIRKRLGWPMERKVVLSVGWIARQHKRMHYVIEEVARMPSPRPYLQLLGAMDNASSDIINLGRSLLGVNGFSVASVPYEQVSDYYKAADCFTLASLQEGFGRVFLEALMHGLPVIAHSHPVIKYVVGDEGIFGDMSRPMELAKLLTEALKQNNHNTIRHRRWQSVKDRFSWEVLAPNYSQMFLRAANDQLV